MLRISSATTYSRKKEEFEIMTKLFSKGGGSCNRPIDIFIEEEEKVYSLFTFLPGYNAEENINRLAERAIGAAAHLNDRSGRYAL